jgi:hypothetical protein
MPPADHELLAIADRRGVPPRPEIEIGRTDDPQEREADRLAERVMRMTGFESPPGAPRRTSHPCQEVAPPIVHDVLSSSGTPLDDAARAFFEPRLGSDLSDVRLHWGATAAESARAVDADAYTVGSDIVFGGGGCAPGAGAGRRLLAHELAHVLQQRTATRVPGPLDSGVPPGPCLANAKLARQSPATGAPSPLSGGLTPRPIELFVDADRKKIAAETTMEIGTAFTAFVSACASNLSSLKAAAKADAEFVALLIDLATGFLAPAFASWQAEKLLGRLADQAAASMKVGNAENMVALIARADILKATFTDVTKVVSAQIKSRSQPLFGEASDEIVLDQLTNVFQSQAVSLAGQIPGMVDRKADAELLSLWHAYDPDYTNVSNYKQEVKHLLDEFARFVKSISELKVDADPLMGDFSGETVRTRAYRVDAFGQQRVMLVEEYVDESLFGRETRKFHAWIPKEWEAFAIDQTEQVFGAFTTITLAELDGSVPDPGP